MNLLFDKSLVQNTASGIALVNEKNYGKSMTGNYNDKKITAIARNMYF